MREGGTLVAHSSSWKSEIRETFAVCYSGLRLEEIKEQQWIVVSVVGEHRRRTGMCRCAWDS